MKFKVPLLLFLLLMFVLSACSDETAKTPEPPADDVQETETPEESEPAPPQETKPSLSLEDFAQGKLDGLRVSLGATKEEIVKEYGEPQEEGAFEGTNYLIYEHFNLSLPPYDPRLNAVELKTDELTMFGVHPGMSLDEIKDVLGEPEYEGLNEKNGGWLLHYQAGGNDVYIEAKNNNDKVNIIRFIARELPEE
ncbi:DUF4309 domain-containing protein [Bacillus tianshenii]|nr:DUF4309 domain-containing protein [Bacillus tianshenii]